MPIARGRVPLVGHALAMARDPIAFLGALRAQGDVVTFYLGTRPIHQINSPELIRRVLVTDAAKFSRGEIFAKARELFGDGLATADEPAHMRQRRIIQPAFHRARLDTYAEVMRARIKEVIDSWVPGRQIMLDREISRLTLAVTAKALFRADLGAAAVEEVCRSLSPILDGVTKRALLPAVFARIPTPGNRRFDTALARLMGIVDDVIKAYRASGTDHGDLLSMLVASEMTDEEVRTQVLNILMAGTDTTSITLSWACYEISRDPAIERRVAAADLAFVDSVIREAVRKYTPVWLLMRKAVAEVALGDVTIGPGEQVMISMPALHRDPRLFADPLRFDPDRWLAPAAKDWPKSQYLPFGAGGHRCIGDAFAWTLMTNAITGIHERWRLRLAPGHQVREVARAFLRPNALPMEPRLR